MLEPRDAIFMKVSPCVELVAVKPEGGRKSQRVGVEGRRPSRGSF